MRGVHQRVSPDRLELHVLQGYEHGGENQGELGPQSKKPTGHCRVKVDHLVRGRGRGRGRGMGWLGVVGLGLGLGLGLG